jgi:superfamily II DNA or RNA helicase
VDPWLPALEKVLTQVRRQHDYRFNRTRFIPEKLYLLEKHETRTVGVVFGGLYSRIKEYVEGYEDLNFQTPLPVPEWGRLEPLRAKQDEVLAAIIAAYRGVIVAPTGFGKTFIIIQLCRIYPQLKILITTMRANVVTDIYRRLIENDASIKASLCQGGNTFVPESQVIVCTAGSLHKIDAAWPDILIYDEVHSASAKEVSKKLAGFSSAKMFGFSASPKGRSDNTDLMTEALFGPPIINIEYKEASEKKLVAPIDVLMMHVEGAIDTPIKTTAINRRGIWRNYKRNKTIADVARKMEKEGQVLILVSVVEHVLALHKLLPDYQFVFSKLDPKRWAELFNAGFTKDPVCPTLNTVQLCSDFRDGRIKNVIATMCWREGVDFPELACLIRGDGQSGDIPSIQIPGRLSRLTASKKRGLLVDFYDDFGDLYRNRSQRRMQCYRKKGWKLLSGGNLK